MDREGTMRVCYSSGPGGNYGGAGANGGSGYALTINPELESVTRQIMAAMGGTQPSELEWEFLFPNPIKRGGNGGSIDGALGNRMMAAYRLAQQGFRKSTD
jgi:hypothetical protein